MNKKGQRTKINQLIDNSNKVLHLDDTNRLYVSRKVGGRGPASIEDCVDSSIQGVEECIKKSKERLITASQ